VHDVCAGGDPEELGGVQGKVGRVFGQDGLEGSPRREDRNVLLSVERERADLQELACLQDPMARPIGRRTVLDHVDVGSEQVAIELWTVGGVESRLHQ